MKFSLVSHLTCPRLHYLPLCSVWNNRASISAFVFALLSLALPIYSLHCVHAPHSVAALPSLVNSLFSCSLFISIFWPSSLLFKSGWAKLGHGPSDQASPVENHFGRGERKMRCCTHLSQVRNTHTCTRTQKWQFMHVIFLILSLVNYIIHNVMWNKLNVL